MNFRARDLRNILAVPAGGPVNRCVEMGAGVFAGVDVVPVPARSPVVVVTDLLKPERDRVGERFGKLEKRGARMQRGGQVDNVDPPRAERTEQILQNRHQNPIRTKLKRSTWHFTTSSPPRRVSGAAKRPV
jgi:hypothetical protein